MIDGVEAAHLQGVVHRDLKPENVLYSKRINVLAVADFGVAHFTEDLLATQVVTGPAQRLANFLYAAPEQRVPGTRVDARADIYALGLMLNEMFTGQVPHGTDYRQIGQVADQLGFLDGIVERMLRQSPTDRPASISEVKNLIRRFSADAVSLQRLSEIEKTVVKVGEIDDPLSVTPPKLIDADWNGGRLTLVLDRPVSQAWINALNEPGNYTAILGKGPETFRFHGNQAFVAVRAEQVQPVVDYFKTWLPVATQKLRIRLEQEARRKEAEERERLRREREAEEERLRVRRQIRI